MFFRLAHYHYFTMHSRNVSINREYSESYIVILFVEVYNICRTWFRFFFFAYKQLDKQIKKRNKALFFKNLMDVALQQYRIYFDIILFNGSIM
jgi:hypothetical protein